MPLPGLYGLHLKRDSALQGGGKKREVDAGYPRYRYSIPLHDYIVSDRIIFDMKTFYEAKAHATGGRGGQVKTDHSGMDLQLSIPKTMGGDGGDGTNPEELFAAGYAACFDSALNHIAGLSKIEVERTAVHSTVGIGQRVDGSFGLAVTLDVEIIGPSREQAEALLHAADTACPYSNAIRGNVDVQLNLI